MRSLFAFLLKHCDSPPVLLIGVLLGVLSSAGHAIPLETVYYGAQPGQNSDPTSTNSPIWTCSNQDLKTAVPNTPTVVGGLSAEAGDDCISNLFTNTGVSTPEPIGFNFKYYGIDYDSFYIYTNGYITLNSMSSPTAQFPNKLFHSQNEDITEVGSSPAMTTFPNNFIAPFWDDTVFNFGSGKQTIYYRTIDTSTSIPSAPVPDSKIDSAKPIKQLIVQWTNAEFYSKSTTHPPLGTFQAILYDNNATCDIRLQYRQLLGDISKLKRPFGNSATIGVENTSGYGKKISYNATSSPYYLYQKTGAQNKAFCLKWDGTSNYTVSEVAYDPVYLSPPPVPPPPIPEITKPTGPTLQCPTVSAYFEWNPGDYSNKHASTDFSIDSYTFIISDDPDFTKESTLFPKKYTGITNTNFTIPTSLTLVNGEKYYAAVISYNSVGGVTRETWSDIKECTAVGNSKPSISSINLAPISVGDSVPTQNFTISDPETAAATLVVSPPSITDSTLATVTLGGTGANRTLNIVPSSGLSGKATITLKVTDNGDEILGTPTSSPLDSSKALFNEVYFELVIRPTLSVADQSVVSGNPLNYTVTAQGSNLSYSYTGSLPAGVNFTAASGTFAGTPTATGTFPITATVTDTVTNESVTKTFNITVTSPAPPPPPPVVYYGLTVKTNGTGKGTVTGSGGINCVNGAGTCYRSFSEYSSVLLSPTPDADSEFTGWSSGCSNSFSISETMTCTATFNLKTFAVTITKPTNGKVSAPGLECGTDCTENLSPDATITLTAEPDPGFVFTGWSGDCAGTTNPLTLTVDKAKNCEAIFAPLFKLTVSASNGSVKTTENTTIDCGSDCVEDYVKDTVVKLQATPQTGYVFSNWAGDCSGSTNPLEINMDAAKTCQAVFTQIQRTLTLNIDNGTVKVIHSTPGLMPDGSNGITFSATHNEWLYPIDEALTLTVVANAGYTFTGWDGDCSGTTATVAVTMNVDKTCHAKMISTAVPMLIIANPKQGKVTGLDIDCGTTCSATYSEPKDVQLTATPEPGYSFTGWSGDCSGTENPLTINVNSAKNCTANFAPTPVTLTLTPPTHGKITAPGLDCGTSCSQTLPPNTEIPLTATPEPGYIFTGWSGDCAGTENPLTVTLSKAKNCQANFAPISLPILVVTNPTQGTVTGSGIDCGTTCTAAYPGKTTATLTATPAPGYTFTGWSGDCSGTANPLSIEVNSGKTCTANFEPILVPLNVTKPTNGKVSIPGLECSNGCNANLPQNSPVTITATPDPGFVFAGWSGDCAGTSNPLTLTLDAAKNCTPIFAPESKPVIIVANPTEGTVSGSGLECGTVCTKTFDAPTTITLTATPKPGFVFTGWSGDCSGTANPLTIEVSKAKSCKANFAPVMLPVTLPKPSNGTVTATGLNCNAATCSGTYPQNSTVTLTATPEPGFVFTGWTGDCSGMENPLTIQVDKAKNCQATFSPIAQPALVIPELDKGTVTGDKIEPCTAACVRPFPKVETVTLTATPEPGYIFTGWSGDCSGMANPITVTIDKATTCVPTFTPAPLVVKVSKPNNGKVKGLGIDCGEDCSENYPYGSLITLTAIPEDGYMFVGWSGSCSGTTNPITVQAELAAQCIPLFTKYVPTSATVYSLITGDTDTSQGTVRSEPAGIECGNDCYQQYAVVTSVQLTATPKAGFAFREWSGDCSGTTAVTTVQVNAVKNCRAAFDPVTQPSAMQPSVLEVILKEGETQQHSIQGGQSPRTITQLPDGTLVDVLWDSPADLLTITGKVVGKTQLIITDGLQRTAVVNITVIPGCRYNMIGISSKGETLDGGFNCITPQVTDFSPNCRNNSVGINAQGKPVFSHSCFSNHVKTRAAVVSHREVVPDAYLIDQLLDFSATITVDPRFVGQKADVLMVAYSAIYGREDIFMRDGNEWVRWDSKPESLKSAQTIDKLPSQFDVQIYTGNLDDLLGDAAVYVGYRLENGNIYYNGIEPIRFQIGNSASMIPTLDTEKNVKSNEAKVGSYFESVTATPDGRTPNHQIFTNHEALSLVTYLLVDKEHVGQPADILMAAIHQPLADKGLSFQRIGESWTLWDGQVASLQPAEHFDKLPDTLEIPIYMGTLSELPGEFVVYVGYRLSDGVIVFNGLSPHHFVVSNALGRDKDGNWTEPTARFINSVNYRNAIHHAGQLTSQEQVGVYSSIWVDPKHVGQKADILMAMLRSHDGKNYASYQRNLEQWEQWDEQQVSLKATIPNVTLETLMKDLQIFSGHLDPGDYLMYIGYRLANGEVIYNGGEEIHIKVNE